MASKLACIQSAGAGRREASGGWGGGGGGTEGSRGMEAKKVGMEGEEGGVHCQPGTTARGSEGCERARGVLEEGVQRGWVRGEQIVETGARIRV